MNKKELQLALAQVTSELGWDEDKKNVELAREIFEQIKRDPIENRIQELYEMGYTKEEIREELRTTKTIINDVIRKVKVREWQCSSKKRAYQQEELILKCDKAGMSRKEIANLMDVMPAHVAMIVMDETAREIIKDNETMTIKELSEKYHYSMVRIRELLKRFN